MMVATIGNWEFRPEMLTLTHSVSGYEIDLEEFHTSAELLDMIFQVTRKRWATPEDLGSMLKAFQYVLQPQANYCGGGADSRVENVREMVEGWIMTVDPAEMARMAES